MAKKSPSHKGAKPKSGKGSYFLPSPLVPPRVPEDPTRYGDYVTAYRIYQGEVNRLRMEFWRGAHAFSAGFPKEVPMTSTETDIGTTRYNVIGSEGRVVAAQCLSYAEAASKLTANGQLVVADEPRQSLSPTIVTLTPSPKSSPSPSPSSSAGVGERRKAARRRQRAAASLRKRAAAAESAKVDIMLNQLILDKAKSVQKLEKFTLVTRKKKSGIPVPTPQAKSPADGPKPSSPQTQLHRQLVSPPAARPIAMDVPVQAANKGKAAAVQPAAASSGQTGTPVFREKGSLQKKKK